MWKKGAIGGVVRIVIKFSYANLLGWGRVGGDGWGR